MTQKYSVQLEIHFPSLAKKMKRIISPLDGFYLDPSKLLKPGDFLIFKMGGKSSRTYAYSPYYKQLGKGERNLGNSQ
jgi:hypothetical protein